MKKEFIDRIIRMGTVDTRSYRYTTREQHDANSQWLEIIRLPISKLDTTAAVDGWEIVKTIR